MTVYCQNGSKIKATFFCDTLIENGEIIFPNGDYYFGQIVDYQREGNVTNMWLSE